MLQDFNLLIACPRMRENEASSETWYFLKKLGDENANIDRSQVSGLIVALTNLEPLQAVQKLREAAQAKPWDFRYILKITPIQKVVDTDLDTLAEASAQMAHMISPSDTFRVTVNKRHSPLKTADIIEAVADKIHGKVDLENPRKVVLIEIIGSKAGMSVLTPSDILSIAKMKEDASRILTTPPDIESADAEEGQDSSSRLS